uniref:EOG090X05T8 n=1 Tax=Alona affinis TaxID=381656 RepID=A0A9N6WSH9_9CRUS|nr:EOG090X05T8 [Alona affinis]
MLRIQSAEGTRRIEVSESTITKDLYEKARDVFGLEGYFFVLYMNRDKSQEIVSSKSKTVSSYGLNHGDMIYSFSISEEPGSSTLKNQPIVTSAENGMSSLPTTVAAAPSGRMPGSKIPQRSNIVEDKVDVILQKTEGTIKRSRDPKSCLHGENSSCIHCLPLEPYDAGYLKEHNIKHMSFHAYLRKLSSGLDGGKYANLENISCRIKGGCSGHLPWPKGVCSKCQPKAITLNSQVYRHVDNIVVENPNLVERFLHYWRVTGHQRIGFLYGR